MSSLLLLLYIIYIYFDEWVWSQTSHDLSHDIDMYGNKDSIIPVKFEIVDFIGWKPHVSQICIIQFGIFVIMHAETEIQFIANYVHFPYIVRE